MTEKVELLVDLEKLRNEYEAWFIGKFGHSQMPIHSRVLDFCWHGYQAGRKTSESEIDRLKGMVDEIVAARKVNSQHDKLLVEIAELRQQLKAKDAETVDLWRKVGEISIAFAATIEERDNLRRQLAAAFEDGRRAERDAALNNVADEI